LIARDIHSASQERACLSTICKTRSLTKARSAVVLVYLFFGLFIAPAIYLWVLFFVLAGREREMERCNVASLVDLIGNLKEGNAVLVVRSLEDAVCFTSFVDLADFVGVPFMLDGGVSIRIIN
jgi:hypothetical protein